MTPQLELSNNNIKTAEYKQGFVFDLAGRRYQIRRMTML